MYLQLKLRIGTTLLILGGLVATLGEILNLWQNDPTTGGWFFSMSLVVIGVLLLTHGITTYAQLSEEMSFSGVISSSLISLCGSLTVVGIIAINVVILPLLLGLAMIITQATNATGVVQNAADTLTSSLNTLKNNILHMLGGQTSSSATPSVHIPNINGLNILDQLLDKLHLPSFAGISQWGHFFFSGGLLTVGCLLLGFSLLRMPSFPHTTSFALIAAAGLNLIGQLCALLLPAIATITGVLFFATIAWLGIAITFAPFQKRAREEITYYAIQEEDFY